MGEKNGLPHSGQAAVLRVELISENVRTQFVPADARDGLSSGAALRWDLAYTCNPVPNGGRLHFAGGSQAGNGLLALAYWVAKDP